MAPQIRGVRPHDAPALAVLERLSPEMGRVAFRVELRVSLLDLAARYPGAKGYVALAGDGKTITGIIFSSVAPTQLDDGLVPAAYLFGLRVHPDYRRRGVASALLAHACALADAEAGARTAFANVIEGNEASLRTVDRAGFVRLRDLRAKLVFGALTPPHALPCLASRPATPDDLVALTTAFNRFYADHNFWRPRTPAQLRAEVEVAGHGFQDTEILAGPDGVIVAAASALEVRRFARLRILGLRALPDLPSRLVAPVLGLVPVNPLLVRYYAFPPDRPAVAAALLQALQRRYFPRSSAALVTADPLDPLGAGLDRLWGVAGRVHVVVKSDRPVDQRRPACLP